MSFDLDAPWAAHYAELGYVPAAFDDRSFGQIIHDQAADRGDAPALQFLEHTLSYADYRAQAAKLANALAGMGVGRGDVVGIHMPNVAQYPIALVAVSMLGAIGTGVSPLLAPPELAYQLADCRAKVLISLDQLAPALTGMPEVPATLQHVILTGAMDPFLPTEHAVPAIGSAQVCPWSAVVEPQPDVFVPVEVAPDDIAMIQYTGGTTGRPKGAQLSHRSLMYNPHQFGITCPPVPGRDTFTSAFPMFHIAGLATVFFGGVFGVRLVLIPDPRNMELFTGMLHQFPPNYLAAVPALYEMLLATPAFERVDWSGLKIAWSGAAPLPAVVADKLEAVIGTGRLSDLFGMTETGPVYTIHPPKRYKRGTVGFPVPLADVRIVDVDTGTREMPRGEAGEIITSGPQVMSGYLNLPAETAHALRDFNGRTYMYSGDIGTMDDDGYVSVCDRAKDMLVVGGYKVFSVEVEDKLMSLPTVAGCAVVASPDEARPGNDIVNLFVQRSATGAALSETTLSDEIISFCRHNMAPYKVPRRVIFVDAIPLTSVAKIDKKVLRAALLEGRYDTVPG